MLRIAHHHLTAEGLGSGAGELVLSGITWVRGLAPGSEQRTVEVGVRRQ
jgi:hypothetical protein